MSRFTGTAKRGMRESPGRGGATTAGFHLSKDKDIRRSIALEKGEKKKA